MKSKYPLYLFLCYLGAVPFIISVILPFFGVHKIPFFGNITTVIDVYGLVIAAFMSGTIWAHYEPGIILPFNPLLASVGSAVILWLSYLLMSEGVFEFILLVDFIFLFYLDMKLHELEIIDTRYYHARFHVTAIVCLCLFIMLWQ